MNSAVWVYHLRAEPRLMRENNKDVNKPWQGFCCSPGCRAAVDELKNDYDKSLFFFCCLDGSEISVEFVINHILTDNSKELDRGIFPLKFDLTYKCKLFCIWIFEYRWIQPTALPLCRSRGLMLVKTDSFIFIMWAPSCVKCMHFYIPAVMFTEWSLLI